jgi:hypothetical protein
MPESGQNYRLEHHGAGYKITSSGANAGQIELDNNWIIQEMTSPVPDQHVTLSIRPHYAKSPSGLLLSSLDARNVEEPSQQIQMTIEYLQVEGVQVPAAFGSKSQHPGGIASFPIKCDRYQIRRL